MWTLPNGQYRNQIDHILCSRRWRSSIQSATIRLRADFGPDHELLIAKFRLELKKVGKTTRPFRYDVNEIPYNYKVEVTSRLKGLDQIDRVPEELWTEVHDIVQEAVIKWSLTLDKTTFQGLLIEETRQVQESPSLLIKYYLLSLLEWFGCEC